jgi:hypothetical protein
LYALNVGSKGRGEMGSWTHDTGIVLNIRHVDGLEQTGHLGVSYVSSVLHYETEIRSMIGERLHGARDVMICRAHHEGQQVGE